MRPAYSSLVTKPQLRSLFKAWGAEAQVPGKGEVTVIGMPDAELRHIEIRPTEHKCTYKKSVLYKVEMWPVSPAFMMGGTSHFPGGTVAPSPTDQRKE